MVDSSEYLKGLKQILGDLSEAKMQEMRTEGRSNADPQPERKNGASEIREGRGTGPRRKLQPVEVGSVVHERLIEMDSGRRALSTGQRAGQALHIWIHAASSRKPRPKEKEKRWRPRRTHDSDFPRCINASSQPRAKSRSGMLHSESDTRG